MKKINKKVLWIGFSTNLTNRVPLFKKFNLDTDVIISQKEHKKLKEYIKIETFKVYTIPNQKNSISYSIKVYNTIKKLNKDYDFIFVNYLHLLSAVLLKKYTCKNSKIILDVLSPYVSTKSLKALIHNFYYKLMLILAKYSCDRIIVLRNEAKDCVKKTVGNDVKIEVAPPGINLNFFKPINKKKKNKTKIIMYHGSVNSERGIEFLLKSFKIISQKRSDVKLYILGTGNLVNYIKRYIKSNNLENKILLFGEFNHKKLKRYLKKADVCVSPIPNHKIHNVNISYKVLESLAMEKPVVAINSPYNTIIDQNHGIIKLVNNDIAEFSNAILYILDNSNEGYRIGKLGRKSIKKRFNWELSTKAMIKSIMGENKS